MKFYLENGGLLGCGIYFADQSTKSNRYCDTTGIREMLLCKVLTGNQRQYRTNNPNSIDKAHFPSAEFYKTYQSVAIISAKHQKIYNNEIAIYKPAQAFPEYLIEYTSTRFP